MLRENYYFKLVGQTPVPCSVEEWAVGFRDPDSRSVGFTRVGPYIVSTVFLGTNYRYFGEGPPILFETMVFFEGKVEGNVEFSEIQKRCCTWIEAEEQHRSVVAQVQGPHDEVVDLRRDGSVLENVPVKIPGILKD